MEPLLFSRVTIIERYWLPAKAIGRFLFLYVEFPGLSPECRFTRAASPAKTSKQSHEDARRTEVNR